MAEFTEVCKQWRRMCDSFGDKACQSYRPCAEQCPVGANPVCGELCESTQEDVTKFEAAIMAWAKEHPEPVYPSWYEYLTDMYPATWNIIKDKPVPADIAQKLGLQPKEG